MNEKEQQQKIICMHINRGTYKKAMLFLFHLIMHVRALR